MTKVLIIEDDDGYREKIREIVEDLGYEPVVVDRDGDEPYSNSASDFVNKIIDGDEKVDVVLMDRDLGDEERDGHDLARRLRNILGTERPKLISISSGDLVTGGYGNVTSLYDVTIPKNSWNWGEFKDNLRRELGNLFPQEKEREIHTV